LFSSTRDSALALVVLTPPLFGSVPVISLQRSNCFIRWYLYLLWLVDVVEAVEIVSSVSMWSFGVF
jgi:hypothetical protein